MCLKIKVYYKCNLIQIKHLLKELKKESLVELILEAFTQVLIENGTEIHGKNLMN